MTKVLLKVNNKVMATDGKLVVGNPTPTGSLEITENGTHNVREYESVEVNVASGGSTLKTLLDAKKSTYYLFKGYQGESVDHLISYNDTENVTDMSYSFYGCSNLTNLPQVNMSKVTDISYMCTGCSKLTKVILETSKVTKVTGIFYNCSGLTEAIIDTSNVTSINSICKECLRLTNIASLDTSKVTDMSSAFSNNQKLRKIDISHYNISSTYNSSYMFAGCRALKAFIIRSFGANYVLNSNNFSQIYTLMGETQQYGNPNGEQGYVYVPRDMISILQNETNWSTLQFRALEDYTDDGTTTGKFLDEKAGL